MEVEENNQTRLEKGIQCSFITASGDNGIKFDSSLLKYFPSLNRYYKNEQSTTFFEDPNYTLSSNLWYSIFHLLLLHEIETRYSKEGGVLLPFDIEVAEKFMSNAMDLMNHEDGESNYEAMFRLITIIDFYNIPKVLECVMTLVVNIGLERNFEQLLELLPRLRSDKNAVATLNERLIVKETFVHTFQMVAKDFNLRRERLRRVFHYYQKTDALNNSLSYSYIPMTKCVLSAGQHFIVLQTQDGLHGIGQNSHGQLSNGRPDDVFGEFRMMHFDKGLENLAICSVWCGQNTTFALTNIGLFACGNNTKNGLAIKEHESESCSNNNNNNNNINIEPDSNSGGGLIPKFQFTGVTDVHEVACGGDGAAMFLTRRGVFTVGSNLQGRLGNGLKKSVFTTEPLRLELPFRCKSIAMGDSFSLLLSNDEYVYFSGNIRNTRMSSPRHIKISMPNGKKVKSMVAGYQHALFLSEDHTVYSIGMNMFGELGVGNTQPSDKPLEVIIPGASTDRDDQIKTLIAGKYCSFFINRKGEAFACGDNTNGRLGVGDEFIKVSPTPILTIGNVKINKIITIAVCEEMAVFLTCNGVFTTGFEVNAPNNNHYLKHHPSMSLFLAEARDNVCPGMFKKKDGDEEKKEKKKEDPNNVEMGASVIPQCHYCGCRETSLLGLHVPTDRHMCLDSTHCQQTVI